MMTMHVRTPPKQVFGSAWSLALSVSANSPTPCLSFPQQHVRSELSFANASISIQIHLAEDLRWDPQLLLVGIFEAIQERCNSANLGLGRRLPHDCVLQSKSKHCWILAILGDTLWTLRASSDILLDCMPLSIVKTHVSSCQLSSSSERVYFNSPTCVQAEAQGNQMRGPQKSSSKLQVHGRGEWSENSLQIPQLRTLWSPKSGPEISECCMVFSAKAQYMCDRCKQTTAEVGKTKNVGQVD